MDWTKTGNNVGTGVRPRPRPRVTNIAMTTATTGSSHQLSSAQSGQSSSNFRPTNDMSSNAPPLPPRPKSFKKNEDLLIMFSPDKESKQFNNNSDGIDIDFFLHSEDPFVKQAKGPRHPSDSSQIAWNPFGRQNSGTSSPNTTFQPTFNNRLFQRQSSGLDVVPPVTSGDQYGFDWQTKPRPCPSPLHNFAQFSSTNTSLHHSSSLPSSPVLSHRKISSETASTSSSNIPSIYGPTNINNPLYFVDTAPKLRHSSSHSDYSKSVFSDDQTSALLSKINEPSKSGALLAGDLMDLSVPNSKSLSLDDLDPLTSFDPLLSTDYFPSLQMEVLENDDKSRPTSMPDPFPEMKIENRLEIETTTSREDVDVDMLDPFSLRQLTVLQQRTVLQSNQVKTENVIDELPPTHHLEHVFEKSYELLKKEARTEIEALQYIVTQLKVLHGHGNTLENPGLVMSTRVSDMPHQPITVKIVVTARFTVDPIVFTCAVNNKVEHLISQVLMVLCEEDLYSISTDDYIFKVFGLTEFLDNDSVLGSYEYVQNCIRLDQDIRLIMIEYSRLEQPLKRTVSDDSQPVTIQKPKVQKDDKLSPITQEGLTILLNTFNNEMEKLQDVALQGDAIIQPKCVVQAVKAICAILSQIETNDTSQSIQKLMDISKKWVTQPDTVTSYRQMDEFQSAVELMTKSVNDLARMYCSTFHPHITVEGAAVKYTESKEVTSIGDSLLLHIASVHRIPMLWTTLYDSYQVSCCLYYGGRPLVKEMSTKPMKLLSGGGVCHKIAWDEWVNFELTPLCTLPRETRMCVSLRGTRMEQNGIVIDSLGWVAMQLFNFKGLLVQGPHLLALWPNEEANPCGTILQNTILQDSVVLQVGLADFGFDVVFPPVIIREERIQREFSGLHPETQAQLKEVIEKYHSTDLEENEREMIWEKREYLTDIPKALPVVLQSAHSWDWACLADIYDLIGHWKQVAPTQAFQLLMPQYPDSHARAAAVQALRQLSSDELCDYLPQVIQVVKFESYMTSDLVIFLLERAMISVRVAHQLFWLLKDAAVNLHYRERYQIIFSALINIMGDKLRKEVHKEEMLVRSIEEVAVFVKTSKDKETALLSGLEDIGYELLQHDSLRLPLNPGMEVTGIDLKSCSYFNSFTFPLKLAFKNIDMKSTAVYTMFKVGDDLRQDMLTLQLIRLMDHLWCRADLNLRIITFKCLNVNNKRGFVEIVSDCETLRKIQMTCGVTGSFKDRPLFEWLQKHNPSQLEYEKAVDNFTHSCAGYCVATYVLGICDRHNDNIMIKQTGHMFHIDFSKFLGDSQMFGNIKRDRTPFVLTSDMAYVINGGEKPSRRFQEFVDLCCQAFNIVRRNSDHFLTLLNMMSASGIPGVNVDAVTYVQKALLPEASDAEATAVFTRMIKDSLKSVFTQINFFFHNLAQLKFSNHTEGDILSFIPRTYSIHTDGRIVNVEVFGYQKRYNPEKFYIYIIKIGRENQKVPDFVFRKYTEFQEFHDKLVEIFPLAGFPPLANRVSLIGRTHVKNVAEKRKGEIEKFLKGLLYMTHEIAECDLVYSFFHPMLRDEKDIDSTNLKKVREINPGQQSVQQRAISGRVKFSTEYKNNSFQVMIMHAEGLANESGEMPDPYVKIYLQPDIGKVTKRKTCIVNGTFHPTYNEMFTYHMAKENLKHRQLQISVWSYDVLKENEFLGAVVIPICDLDLTQLVSKWYPLGSVKHMTSYR